MMYIYIISNTVYYLIFISPWDCSILWLNPFYVIHNFFINYTYFSNYINNINAMPTTHEGSEAKTLNNLGFHCFSLGSKQFGLMDCCCLEAIQKAYPLILSSTIINQPLHKTLNRKCTCFIWSSTSTFLWWKQRMIHWVKWKTGRVITYFKQDCIKETICY